MATFPRALRAELLLGTVWTDVTADVRQTTPVTITRGRQNETAKPQPSTAKFELDDKAGKYSPRNPQSPLYGVFGRNTPVRFSLPGITEDFEDTNLNIVITNGGNAPWVRSTAAAHGGSWSLRSGVITHNQTSDAIVTVPSGASVINFWYRVSSEAGFDVLRVIIGGVEVLTVSGTGQPWKFATFPLTGATTVTFRYSKDSIVSTGEDAGYIDDLEFPNVRFTGEIATVTPRWNTANGNRTVAVEAAGILRRLTQGASPLQSSMRRGLTTNPKPPVAYWACEEGKAANQISSTSGGPPMTFTGGPPKFAANTAFACSAPLPALNNSVWTGTVPGYTDVNLQSQSRFLLSIPDAGEAAANNGVIFRVHTTGTAARWDVMYGNGFGGILGLKIYDRNGVLIHDGTLFDFDMNGQPARIGVTIGQNGANVDWFLAVIKVPDDINTGQGSADGGTLTNRTAGVVSQVTVNPAGVFKDTAVGHVSVNREWASGFDMLAELGAWVGETAVDRFQRLCAQEGISATHLGDPATSAKMGAQDAATLVDLLTECAQAELGELYEPRGALGLLLRTRATLYNQTPKLTVNYAGHQVAPPLAPVDDDQLTRNDILCKREDGSEYRAVLDTGRLSVRPPPAGVGRYDTAVTVNVHRDTQLPDIAGWLLRLGTVDEARYPKVRVDLRAPDVSAALADAVMAVDIGDRITITNLTAINVYGTVSQIVRGHTETLDTAYAHSITFNCTPESPWQVITLDDPLSRVDGDQSTLASAINATQTTLSVSTGPDPHTNDFHNWTANPADMPIPITIGGEDMLVTAVTGPGPQTFTVTRSVNGVTKTHPAGTPVRLTRDAAVSF